MSKANGDAASEDPVMMKFLSTKVESAVRRHAHIEQNMSKPCSPRRCIFTTANAAHGAHGSPGCLMHPGRHGQLMNGPRTQTSGKRPCDKNTGQTLLLMLPERCDSAVATVSGYNDAPASHVLIQLAPGVIKSLHQGAHRTPRARRLPAGKL